MASSSPHTGSWFLVVALCAAPAAAHDPRSPSGGEADWAQTLSLEELLQLELAAPSKQRQQARGLPASPPW
jgi:hypothetical protein